MSVRSQDKEHEYTYRKTKTSMFDFRHIPKKACPQGKNAQGSLISGNVRN